MNIKQILNSRSQLLENSDKKLADIFDVVFLDGDNILCEGNDGFRTYRHTYGAVKDRIEGAAGALYEKIGDSHGYVALACDNSEEWIVGFWAILMIYSIPIETKLAAAIIEKAVTLVDNIPKCIEITRQGVIEFILLDTPR